MSSETAASIRHQALDLAWQFTARLSTSHILAAIAAFLLSSFLTDCLLRPRYPSSLPRVGHGRGPVATVRNWLSYFTSSRQWFLEGYNKYSKHGRAFVAPNSASQPDEIVIPPSQAAWMLDLPDHVLSAHAAHDDVLFSPYNFLHNTGTHTDPVTGRHRDDGFHNNVIHRNLVRHLPGLIPDIEAEVAAAVDLAFAPPPSQEKKKGTTADDDPDAFYSVNLWDAWLIMVSRITNRILVGPGVCHDPTLVKNGIKFADAVITNSMLLVILPKVLHPIVGRLLRLYNHSLWRNMHAVLEPVVRERLAMLQLHGRHKSRDSAPVPEDYLTWHIRTALQQNSPEHLVPREITKFLMPLEFAAIHTTVLTGHTAMLDLLSSDPSRGYLDSLRAEMEAVRPENNNTNNGRGSWTKAQLAGLWHTDSAIRESMRLSNFSVAIVKRKVVAPEGLTNPAEGWHVPPNSILILATTGVHHDPDIHDHPLSYDAFRYVRLRAEAEAREAEARAASPAEGRSAGPCPDQSTGRHAVKSNQLGMVTTSSQHLGFGHGRHACPGRFFVAHELKMIFAHLLTNYEIQPLPQRPEPQWIGQTIIPPLSVKIQVRRRRT